ncbi:MAG: Clp protease N-terminal domain-containing protein [bacterium]|nr:Clp protease N-terminal domain-containing protein [bacterium]
MVSYNRYSHHARRALTHAGSLVRRFRHPRVDTGHLLVGVMLAEGSVGHAVLEELNLSAETAFPYLAVLTMPLDHPVENPANDAALDVALELAADEASWLGHHYIGTEHLLLGITRTNVGNASDLLRTLNVSADQVRRRVRRALNDGLMEFNLEDARRSTRLSELSRRVLNAAEQMAVSLDHPNLGIGHLLLILTRESRSPTSKLLQQSGLNERAIERLLQERDPFALTSVKRILDQAVEQAQMLGSHYTGTEHLLLAVLADAVGQALLERSGVLAEALQRRIQEQLLSRK